MVIFSNGNVISISFPIHLSGCRCKPVWHRRSFCQCGCFFGPGINHRHCRINTRSTFLAGVFAGDLPGLGGQAASGGCLRIIELLVRGAALLFHNRLNLSFPKGNVNSHQEINAGWSVRVLAFGLALVFPASRMTTREGAAGKLRCRRP